MIKYGPTLELSEEIHSTKYRDVGESFEASCNRVSSTLSDNDEHRRALSDILLNMRFLPAGRVQAAIGSTRRITPYNCFVSGTISDDFNDIMEKAKEAGQTMRLGGGIGYDFSTLRPRGNIIKSLGSQSSGPVSFMDIYDAICGTIASAGHRRGAQMGVLRVDHPDIEEFIHSKEGTGKLKRFNISVGVTDPFMEAVKKDSDFNLKFRGRTAKTVKAKTLWNSLMRSTWDWAEPGVLFIDRINEYNNLWYCETLSSTNPCAEQPLPPYGACLLGSFNLVKYINEDRTFNYSLFQEDIISVVRAMDNIIDQAIYPLPQQEEEARSKRRMGLGLTGVANALEYMGYEYGSKLFLSALEIILILLRNTCYDASMVLSKEKGPFPLFDERYLDSKFIETLPLNLRSDIKKYGIRNSHLLSIAPTGTISLAADNISSGIEPVFSHSFERVIQTFEGPRTEQVEDYGYRTWGIKGRTANEISVDEHVNVLITSQKYVDSSVSKTCNVGDDVTWDQFKDVYIKAFDGGAKGCTTFRKKGKLAGILNENPTEEFIDDEDSVCRIDESTGQPTCS